MSAPESKDGWRGWGRRGEGGRGGRGARWYRVDAKFISWRKKSVRCLDRPTPLPLFKPGLAASSSTQAALLRAALLAPCDALHAHATADHHSLGAPSRSLRAELLLLLLLIFFNRLEVAYLETPVTSGRELPSARDGAAACDVTVI